MTKHQLSTIEAALECPEYLSEWENGFVESLSKLHPDTELSENQEAKLIQVQRKLEEDYGYY